MNRKKNHKREDRRHERTNNRTEKSRVGTPLEQLVDELEQNLAAQLEDGLALPAWICQTRHGQTLAKNLLSLDTQGQPLSDADLATHVERQAPDEAALHGVVRLDEELPRILVWYVPSGLAVSARPRFRDYQLAGWRELWSTQLDREPRGGKDGPGVTMEMPGVPGQMQWASFIAGLLDQQAQELLPRLRDRALDELKRRLSQADSDEALGPFSVVLPEGADEIEIRPLAQPPQDLSTEQLLVSLARVASQLQVDGVVMVFVRQAGEGEAVHLFGFDPRSSSASLRLVRLEWDGRGVRLDSWEAVPAALLAEMLSGYLEG